MAVFGTDTHPHDKLPRELKADHILDDKLLPQYQPAWSALAPRHSTATTEPPPDTVSHPFTLYDVLGYDALQGGDDAADLYSWRLWLVMQTSHREAWSNRGRCR